MPPLAYTSVGMGSAANIAPAVAFPLPETEKMVSNGTNGVDSNGISGWKHYNEGTFLFTVSSATARLEIILRD